MRLFQPAALALALVTAAPAGPAAAQAQAQGLLALGGEHADFTRIVLQGTVPIDWSLVPDGRRALLRIDPEETPVDLSRVFDRIPRQRLAAIERSEGGIRLLLSCDCPVRAFSDRPGVVVIDIMDPPNATENDRVINAEAERDDAGTNASGAVDEWWGGAAATAAAQPPPSTNDHDIARRAGATLAKLWPAGSASSGTHTGPARRRAAVAGETATPAAVFVDRHALRRSMQDALARAVDAGLLIGADDLPGGTEPTATGQLPPKEPAQMRIATPAAPEASPADTAVLPWAGSAENVQANDPHCRELDALDFLDQPEPPDFNKVLAELFARLYGEFDRPDPEVRTELARHYLSAGMGAEARLLIDNARHPIAGRDLLRGLADILDDRPSNARLKLAGLHGCPGPGGMLAALAGPPAADLAPHADAIVLAYANAPPALRRLFGPVLTERLVDAEAIEAARVVAEKLRLTGPAGTVAPVLPEALLERARGSPARAAENLAAQQGVDSEALLRRLQFMLEAGTAAGHGVIDQAEALAAGARHSQQGIDLMEAAIRHDTLRGAHDTGFERLDRLGKWLRPNRADRQLLAELSDALWKDAANTAGDQRFLALILARVDWRAAGRAPATRSALAARLLDLGLAEAAAPLIEPPGNDRQRHLLARAMLAGDRADEAITLLAPLIADGPANADPKAGLLMARALRAVGATDAALVAFSELGALDEAAGTAIARRDWQALTRLAQQTAAHDTVNDGPEMPPPSDSTALEPADAGVEHGTAVPDGQRVDLTRPTATAVQTLDMLQRLAQALGSDPASGILPGGQAPTAAEQAAAIAGAPPAGHSSAAGIDDTGMTGPVADLEAGEVREGAEASPGNAPDSFVSGPGVTDGPLILRRNAALLNQSAELRSAIDALLSNTGDAANER